jgi:hypothetical protein
MSSNATTNFPNDSTPIFTSQEPSSPLSQHANTSTIPLNADPVTTVFPNVEEQHSPAGQKVKSKKKKSSKSSTVKKTPKPKRGDSKTSLTMEDMYLKGNPFIAEANVESSMKESNVADVEAPKDNPTHSEKESDTTERTEVFEKGNSEQTLKTDDDKIVENLRVDDMKCDDTAGSKIDETRGSKVTDHTNVEETVEIPIEK